MRKANAFRRPGITCQGADHAEHGSNEQFRRLSRSSAGGREVLNPKHRSARIFIETERQGLAVATKIELRGANDMTDRGLLAHE